MIIKIGEFHLAPTSFLKQFSIAYSGIINSETYSLCLLFGTTTIPVYFPIDEKEIELNGLTFHIISVKTSSIELEHIKN